MSALCLRCTLLLFLHRKRFTSWATEILNAYWEYLTKLLSHKSDAVQTSSRLRGSSTYLYYHSCIKSKQLAVICVYLVLTRGPKQRKRIFPVLQSGATWPLVHDFAVQGRTNVAPSADTAVWQETPLVCRTWSVSWQWRQGNRHDSMQCPLDLFFSMSVLYWLSFVVIIFH